jgi:hypothetical protein
MEPIERFKHRGCGVGLGLVVINIFFTLKIQFQTFHNSFFKFKFMKILQKHSKCLKGYTLKGPTTQMFGPHHVIRYSNIFLFWVPNSNEHQIPMS